MSSAPTASIHTAGALLNKRYRLDHPIATGGMAEVWQGTDLVLQRSIAIKVLHPHLATDAVVVKRFHREAVSAARLSHPNIVPTFDAGTDGDTTFIVLGLINGPSLDQVLKVRHFSPYEAANLGRQIADALEHAHQHNLIHRDIKPSNLLLVDGERRVLVSDFGIAKAIVETADTTPTLPGLVVATPNFAAPEQLDGAPVTVQGDLYSLGIVIHEMICGHIAIDGQTQLRDTSLAPHERSNCNALPPQLRDIIVTATEPDPKKRYEHASDMRLALLECVNELRPSSHDAVLPTVGLDDTATLRVPLTTGKPSTSAQSPDTDYISNAAQRVEVINAQHAFERLWRRSIIVTAVVVLIAVALGLLIRFQAGTSSNENTPTTSSNSRTRTITGANSFDPFGDRGENEAQVRTLFDNNADTTWSTETYASRVFGNLKPGVGVFLTTREDKPVARVEIDSPSQGWSAQVFTSTTASDTPAGWGESRGTIENAQVGTTSISATNATGRYVLIWLTDLGTANRFTASEVRVYTA